MRLSLSVPDTLWLRARQASPAAPPSRQVRAALEQLLADVEAGYLPGPPACSSRASPTRSWTSCATTWPSAGGRLPGSSPAS
ncbi:MAG TPA: hypothetical protein VLW53_07720 [Candidatus Eisenbacteria bacterium]|nr:hypothetical protein [Candidatus Eisenbacteria bacterium]